VNRGNPSNLKAIAEAGFDVVSLASNHTVDWGADALLDCIEGFQINDIATIGAGKDIAEARKPAIFERKGHRVAFLGYCSVAPDGYYAASAKPGVSPMRAITHYEPMEPDQPGMPARIMTFPVERDLESLLDDVRAAKEKAEFVALSMHWGLHFHRAVLADYQREVAHAAIDAGADIIFGHHPHMLKGVEVYGGKVIFYSLGNFAMDFSIPHETRNADFASEWQEWLREASRFYVVPVQRDPKTAGRPQHRRSNKAMLAKWTIANGTSNRISFIPCLINERDEPTPVDPTSPEGEEFFQYLVDITDEAGLDTRYEWDESEIIVVTR
jgi:poly-gamma-glutamate synthesis protein (capsule biosynthesis protein)